jgi:hypothetical protein
MSKLLLNSASLIYPFLVISSTSFAMMVDLDDPLYEEKMAFLRTMPQNQPVYTPFNHDPDRVRMEKENYTFSPLNWKIIEKSDATQQVRVPMGRFHWAQSGSDTLLYTDRIQDCIGVGLVGPQVGLGHISNCPKDHNVLKEALRTIKYSEEFPEKYTISFASHYYSDNLKKVYEIVRETFPTFSIYADISNNALDYGLDAAPWKYYYSDPTNMQVQNFGSRTICIDAKTARIAQTMPQ